MKKICAVLLSLALITFMASCGGSGFADVTVSSYPSFEVYRAGSAETTGSPGTEAETTVAFETIPPTSVTEPPETVAVTTSAPDTTAETTMAEPPVTDTTAETTEAEPPVTEAPATAAVTEAVTTAETEAETAAETTPVTTVTPTREIPTTGTVYWVKNGEVWHIKESCSSLSRSKNIQSGTVSDAIAAGKERVCKRCGGSG